MIFYVSLLRRLSVILFIVIFYKAILPDNSVHCQMLDQLLKSHFYLFSPQRNTLQMNTALH